MGRRKGSVREVDTRRERWRRTLGELDLGRVFRKVRLTRKRRIPLHHLAQSSEDFIRARNGETRSEDRLN
jgi:hypothetical protein